MKSTIGARTSLPLVLMAVLWTSGLSGCSITQLQHDALQEPEHRHTGTVMVEPAATGFSGGRVGWGRATIFSIPVAPVYIKSDEAGDLMNVVSNALIAAGYTPVFRDEPQVAPVLKAHVDDVRFNNYTWFAPIVPTWGRMNVTLRLESSGGDVLWERAFAAKGRSFDFTDGYNKAATRIITQLANSMVEAFTSREFSDVLAGGG